MPTNPRRDQRDLRRGYLMQLWAAVYALYRVYPHPRLTTFVLALVAVLAVLIADTHPATAGWWR